MNNIILIREQNYFNYSNSFPEIIAKGDSLNSYPYIEKNNHE